VEDVDTLLSTLRSAQTFDFLRVAANGNYTQRLSSFSHIDVDCGRVDTVDLKKFLAANTKKGTNARPSTLCLYHFF
jgi:hypothetical protein